MDNMIIKKWIASRFVVAKNENLNNLVVIVRNGAGKTYDYLRFFTIGSKTECSIDFSEMTGEELIKILLAERK